MELWFWSVTTFGLTVIATYTMAGWLWDLAEPQPHAGPSGLLSYDMDDFTVTDPFQQIARTRTMDRCNFFYYDGSRCTFDSATRHRCPGHYGLKSGSPGMPEGQWIHYQTPDERIAAAELEAVNAVAEVTVLRRQALSQGGRCADLANANAALRRQVTAQTGSIREYQRENSALEDKIKDSGTLQWRHDVARKDASRLGQENRELRVADGALRRELEKLKKDMRAVVDPPKTPIESTFANEIDWGYSLTYKAWPYQHPRT